MTGRQCAVGGCGRPIDKGGYGLCGMHYSRQRRSGDVGVDGYIRPPGRSMEERVFTRLREDPSTGCWEWQGALSAGYGAVGGSDGRKIFVHRWVYEHLVGDIPEGLVIDHLCANRRCANPEHLDPVTRAVNNARGNHGLGATA